jgi:hypothetical protein
MNYDVLGDDAPGFVAKYPEWPDSLTIVIKNLRLTNCTRGISILLTKASHLLSN